MDFIKKEKRSEFVLITYRLFTAFNVTNLTPGKEYKFRVTAVNAEGESSPLQSEQSIVAKNPFGKYIFMFTVFELENSKII